MATNRYISIGMGVDIADLKTGLSQARSEMRLADSEFKKRTAGLDSWETSVLGLTEKLVALSSKIETQRGYVEQLGKQWADAKEKFGEGSKKANDALSDYNNAQSTLTKMLSEYEKYSGALDDLSSSTDLAATGTKNLKNAVDELENHVSQQTEAVRKTKEQLQYVKKEYGEDSEQAKKLTEKLETQEGQLDLLNGTLKDYKTALDNAESEAGQLDSEMDNLEDSIKDADRAADNAGTGGFSSWKMVMADLTSKVISGLIDKTKELATQTLQLGIDFDGTMAKVQANSGASAEEMEKLKNTAREFGATTTFSASESAEALNFMAVAGWDANQSADALGGVLNLAAASGMDLGKASDIVTDYLGAFGMEASQSGEFADKLAYAQSHANTTAEQLGEAYKNSAPLLHANGQEVDTVTALLAALANQGVKGGEAGTALAAIMRDITTKMTDTGIAIGDASVAVVDADGNFRSLTDIIADVESVTANMTDAQRATALQTTFTSDSMKGLSIILGQGTDSVKAFEEGLASSDGTAQAMADTMNDNLGGDIKQLKSAFEELQLKLYDLLNGPLRGVVQFITDNLPLVITLVAGVGAAFAGWKVAKVLGEMTGSIQKVIPIIQALTSSTALSTAGEIAHTAATTAMTAAQGLATAATTALSGAMAFLAANPIVLVIAAIAAIVAAIVLLYDNCEWFRDAIDGIWNAIVGFFEWAYNEIVKVWDTLVGFFSGVWDGIQKVFAGVGQWFSDLFQGAVKFVEDPWGSITNFFGGIWNSIKGVFDGVGSFFSGVFDGAVNGIKGAFNGIKSFFEGIWNGIVGFFKPILSIFGINIDGGGDSKESQKKALEESVADAEKTLEMAQKKQSLDYQNWQDARKQYGVGSEYERHAYKAYSLTSQEVSSARAELSEAQKELSDFSNSKSSGNGTGGFVSDLTKNIKDGLTNGLAGIGDIITKPFKAAWDGITGIFGGIGSWFNDNVLKPVGDALGGITDAVGDVVGGVAEGIASGANDVVNGVQSFGEDVFNGFCDFFGIHSPSRLMRDKVGKMIGAGIADGISLSEIDAIKSMQHLSQGVNNALNVGSLTGGVGAGGTVIFNQTITSPTALSTGQIYRDTRSLISRRQWA